MNVITLRAFALISIATNLSVTQSWATNYVAGDLIVFNDNGAWSWFEDERAVFDAAYGRIVVSSVANAGGPDSATRGGDIDVVSYDIATASKKRFTLHKNLEQDDHDSAALMIMPDGRYLASYSKHAGDNRLRYRLSVKPGDVTAWAPEETFFTAGPTTYSNLCYLSKPDTIFNFHRDSGRGFDPNFLLWKLDSQSTFAYGGHLLTGPEGNNGRSDRPYLRYVGNGVDRIHFITSDHHPRNLFSNSVYHGYIQFNAGRYSVHRSNGERLGRLSETSTSPFKASDFTPLLVGGTLSPMNDMRMTRAWPIDIELDRSGNPCVLFTARVDDNDHDHRFFFGRYTSAGWRLHELAKAGGYLYERENDYTGLAALDPKDLNRVLISTKIDPRDERILPHYEIFDGQTYDGGSTWNWSPITYNSSTDNLRPIVPRSTSHTTALLWIRGSYNSYTNYNTSIVGLTRIVLGNIASISGGDESEVK